MVVDLWHVAGWAVVHVCEQGYLWGIRADESGVLPRPDLLDKRDRCL